MMNRYLRISAPLALLLLSSCSLADKFVIPGMDVPAIYKEQTPAKEASAPAKENKAPEKDGLWAPAQPLDKIDCGAWWQIFGDDTLNQLESQAWAANQELKAAAARVQEARSLARSQAPTLFPDLSIGGNAVRAQPAAAGQAAFGGPGNMLNPYTLYQAQGVATYEVDLFGRVRTNYRALMRDADATQSAYRNVLLSLQASVAQAYFSLRAIDAERKILRDTVATRARADNMMKRRLDLGDVRLQDSEQARADLAAAKADLAGVERRRAALEHALAVLLGIMPSSYSFPETPLTGVPPAIPPGLPSTLLERRPDIAAAVSAMAAANERIGTARAAFFPTLDLTASGGFESTSLGDLFQWPMRTWALGQLAGTALNLTIFDDGRRAARVDRAQAAFEEAVANYRQQVLVAFRDVEDNLSDQRLLAQQSKAANEAARTSTHATELTRRRFEDGDTDYFEVVESQRNSLAAERAAVQIRGQRFVTTVALIQALGGGWGANAAMPAIAQAPQASAPVAASGAKTHRAK